MYAIYVYCILYTLLYYMRVIFCRHMFIVCSSSQPGGCCTGPTRRGVDKWTRRVDEWTTLTGCSCHVAQSDLSKGFQMDIISLQITSFKSLWFCQAETSIGVPTESRSCGKLSVGLPGLHRLRQFILFFGSFLNENLEFGGDLDDLMEYTVAWMQVFTPLLSSVFFTAAGDIFGSSKIEAWNHAAVSELKKNSEISIFSFCHFVSCISTRRLHVLLRCWTPVPMVDVFVTELVRIGGFNHDTSSCKLSVDVICCSICCSRKFNVVQCCSIFMKMFQWCEISLLVEVCWF